MTGPLTFEPGKDVVYCDGARMNRAQCEELLSLWQREHDALLRIGSIEATCWARKIRKSWLALSFTASCVWPDPELSEVYPDNIVTLRGLPDRWAAVPNGDAA